MQHPCGRRFLSRLAGLLVGICLLEFATWAQTADTYHFRADQALQSFLLKFWKGSSQYLRNVYPSDSSLTGYWTFAQGWDAVMDGVERTAGQQYSGFIEAMYLGQDSRGWTNNYYDDECWMTLTLTRAYDLTGDLKYLNQAAALYADIMTGWDTTCCGGIHGGVWWDKAHTQKATAANAGAALAGARLYVRTGNSAYLNFSRQVYSFWYTNMVNLSTYQVCDHINPDGTKVWWQFTYNEGLMVGASLALYEATGDSGYYTKAYALAGRIITAEVTSTAYGPVLYDGDNAGCGGDCHEFKGPAYRYLMQMYSLNTNSTQFYRVLKASVDALWNLARNTTSTVFSVNWAGPIQTNFDQGQVNAACMALNRFAQQYGPFPGTGLATNVYEAENATLHHLGVEAAYGAYSGWAYVAGWNGNGQSVDFKIRCPTAGPYLLSFRYAAGAGNASRTITLNGTAAFPSQSFLNTGSWSVYTNLTLGVNLAAGMNTVSITFDSTRGSANYLNLDNVSVVPDQIILKPILLTGSNTVLVTWSAVPGGVYQLQISTGTADGPWNNLGSPITASSTNVTWNDSLSSDPGRFYRVQKN